MTNNLIHLETLVPESKFHENQLIIFYDKWLDNCDDEEIKTRGKNIVRNTGIKTKYSILKYDDFMNDNFFKRNFTESNTIYKEKAIEYGIKIVDNTLQKSNIKAEEIDFLVTTSCTGLMSPSINSFIINHFKMRNDVIQIPIAQTGCSGGTYGLIYIDQLLKSKLNSKAMLINLEFNSNTMQSDNYNIDNIIGTAIFGDGISCAVFSNQDEGLLKIIDTKTHQFYNTIDILRYDLGQTGFTLHMEKELPVFVANHYVKEANSFLDKHGLSLGQIDRLVVHPGGIRILEKIEEKIASINKNLNYSKYIMENYGNMSSATVMFILAEKLKYIKKGEKILMTSFGPGFVANFILFEAL